jgi:aminoglycoside phosphotransferase (APT) family kinase protein
VPVASIEQVAAALQSHLGITATGIRRQTRWRPTWFVEGERDGLACNVVVRGERVDTQAFPLRHEVAFHRILEAEGIPVPHVLGFIDELDAVVLAEVPGKPDFDGVAPADRDVVVDEYLQALARIHRLDLAPFVEAGIMRAATPEESGVVGHWHMEKIFRAAKRRPDPFMEFCLGWLHRHPPQSHGREAAIPWDTGQFHHVDGHLVSILDLEFGHIGDPMLDLAVWRMRDTLIPFGDFDRLYDRYEELSGTPVDREAVQLHHIGATLGNQLMFGPAVADPVPDTDLMNNMQWNSETNLHATEALAEYLDIELPTVAVPEPRSTRQDEAFAHLVGALRGFSTDDYLLRHDLRLAFRMARHLQRTNQIGDAVVAADLDDLHDLLGSRPATWADGDADLEGFVLADATTGEHDEDLIRLFHRRNLRIHMQLGPEGSKMVAHFPTQPFRHR